MFCNKYKFILINTTQVYSTLSKTLHNNMKYIFYVLKVQFDGETNYSILDLDVFNFSRSNLSRKFQMALRHADDFIEIFNKLINENDISIIENQGSRYRKLSNQGII